MVDSGATPKFLHRWLIVENYVMIRKLVWPIPLYNVNSTKNHNGTISEVAILDMAIRNYQKRVVFVVTNIGENDIIIGLN